MLLVFDIDLQIIFFCRLSEKRLYLMFILLLFCTHLVGRPRMQTNGPTTQSKKIICKDGMCEQPIIWYMLFYLDGHM